MPASGSVQSMSASTTSPGVGSGADEPVAVWLGAEVLLAADDVRMKDLWRPRRFWFRETLLKVGDHVSVVGRPSSLAIDAAGNRSLREPPQLRVMTGTAEEPVPVIDDDE